ncbi:polysaccharide biosynthesis/export family protein, partial [Alteromonas sp.]
MSQYQLGSGDRIQISVFGQDDLSMEVRLPDVGTINYPFLGEIKLVG